MKEVLAVLGYGRGKVKNLSDSSDSSDSKILKTSYEGENHKKSMEFPVTSCHSEANSDRNQIIPFDF